MLFLCGVCVFTFELADKYAERISVTLAHEVLKILLGRTFCSGSTFYSKIETLWSTI